MNKIKTDSLPLALFILSLLGVSVYGYFVCARDPIFRSFDQADIALVARNLVRGNGFTTDAIWLWVSDWGTPHHPADVWPLLQPMLTALSFLVFEPGVFAQKAVCVAQLLALLIIVFYIGKRIFGAWEGLLAAALVMANDRIPLLLAMGLNDIGAAFLYMGAIYAAFYSFDENSSRRPTIYAGLWTGLSILQKFQGAVLAIAYVLWQAIRLPREPGKVLRQFFLFFAVLFVIGLPMMIRNMKAFGQPTYPTSAIVSSLGSAWDPSYMRWRGLMVHYKLYWEHEKPSYSYLILHRGKKYVFIKRPAEEFARLCNLLARGIIINRAMLFFAILGAVAAWRINRKWVKWNGVVFFTSLLMVFFRNVEARYYLFLVPMASIFASCFLMWSIRRLKKIDLALAIIFVPLCALIIIYPVRDSYLSTVNLSAIVKSEDAEFLKMCAWLKYRLQPDEGVMSYDAATVAYVTERTAACIPNIDLAEWIKLADRYKLRFFIIHHTSFYLGLFSQAGTQHWVLRQMSPLLKGRDAFGFKLEYTDGKELFVYRIPLPGEIDLNSLPKLPPEPSDFTRLLLPPDRGGYREMPPPLAQ